MRSSDTSAITLPQEALFSTLLRFRWNRTGRLMENRNAIAIDRSPQPPSLREVIAPLLIQLHLIKPLQDLSNDLPPN